MAMTITTYKQYSIYYSSVFQMYDISMTDKREFCPTALYNRRFNSIESVKKAIDQFENGQEVTEGTE